MVVPILGGIIGLLVGVVCLCLLANYVGNKRRQWAEREQRLQASMAAMQRHQQPPPSSSALRVLRTCLATAAR